MEAGIVSNMFGFTVHRGQHKASLLAHRQAS